MFPIPCPPLTESPFASAGCYPTHGDVPHHLRGNYPSFIAPTGSCAPPLPSRDFRLPLYRKSLQVATSPCWQRGGSRRYLHNPCIGAWTRTPPRSPGAFTRFFPEDIGLTLDLTRSARETLPAKQLPQGVAYEAAVIPLCSGSHAC